MEAPSSRKPIIYDGQIYVMIYGLCYNNVKDSYNQSKQLITLLASDCL
jgi:hypothetical protein